MPQSSFGPGGDFESRRRFENPVAVAHPDAPHAIEQARRFNGIEFPRSVLPLRGRFNASAKFFPDQLHAVADAENGNSSLKMPGSQIGASVS